MVSVSVSVSVSCVCVSLCLVHVGVGVCSIERGTPSCVRGGQEHARKHASGGDA
jgi:hypothetical protein